MKSKLNLLSLFSLLFLAVLIAITTAVSSCSAVADDGDSDEDDDDRSKLPRGVMKPSDEEKHRPAIRCVACERMAKEYIRRMHTTPLGRAVKAGRPNEGSERGRHKTANLWATELLGGLCDQLPAGATRRDQLYCEQAEEACEDLLVAMATKHQLDGTVDKVPVNETAERICTDAKYCELRSRVKKEIDNMHDRIQKEYQARVGIAHLVWRELERNWMWYLGFFALSTIGFTALAFLVLTCLRKWRRRKQM